MINFSDLCPNSTFYIYSSETQSLGDCFLQTALLIPANVLFSILSGYLLGSSPDISRHVKLGCLHTMRLIACLLLLIRLISTFVRYFVFSSTPSAISLISDLYELFALSIYSIVLFNKQVLIYFYPFYILIAFILLSIANLISFVNFCFVNLNQIRTFNFETNGKFTFISLLLFNVLLISSVFSLWVCLIRLKKPTKRITNETEPLIQTKSESKAEEDQANYLSYLMFGWLQPIMVKGYQKQIHMIDHLSQLPIDLDVSQVCDSFMKKYNSNTEQHQNNPIINPEILLNQHTYEDLSTDTTPSVTITSTKNLGSALMRSFGRKFMILGVFKLLNDIISFSGPLLLNQLVQFVETKNAKLKDGCMFAAALLLSTLVGSIINIHFSNALNKLCLRIRTALITLIYRKAVLVRLDELNRFSTGQIVNYMSIDTDSVVNAFPSFHSFWSLPFQIAVTLYLLYSQIGISFLVGVGFVIILIPINKVISDYIGKVQHKLMTQKDSRVKLMTEFLNGIKVIKFYAWEKYFLNRINVVREKELKQLKAKKYLDAGCVYFWATTPILMSVFTFITYVLLGNKLTPSKVFTSLALFNMLISPLNSFPWVINGLVQALVSFKRLKNFLNLHNLDWLTYYSYSQLNGEIESNIKLEINNADFKWKLNDDSSDALALTELDFEVKQGQLIGIVGKVGCGKTSLLHAIMAEIGKISGQIQINAEVCSKGFGYVGQDGWIKAGSIKENILFGSELNQEFYNKVIEACALGPDLSILAHGDETFVGENGITLSGGQKTRLALARACYAADKDVYLFDDPLSAVDAHVAKHIYTKCIAGLLGHKTRIVSTHHVDYLVDADLVLVIEDGRVVRSGIGSELIPKLVSDSNSNFKLVKSTKVANTSFVNQETDENESDEAILIKQQNELNQAEIQRQEDEEKEHGVIHFQVYKYYCLAVGLCLTFLTLLTLLLMQASRNLTDFWLSYWTQHHQTMLLNATRSSPNSSTAIMSTLILNPHTIHFYSMDSFQSDNRLQSVPSTYVFFYVYGALCLANSFFTLFRAFFFAYSGILAGKYIHRRLVDNLSKANLKFFQNVPTGRVLNRLSSDMYAIDDSLPFILNIFLANIFGLLGVLAVTCYSLPWFSLSLVPLSIIYYNIQNYYRWTSRELKRLQSISLSPVYTHFHETLAGITTIRAFRQISRFINKNESYLNNYIRASYVSMAASQWLNFRLQMISVVMITAVGFTAVFQHIYSTANASLVGLALSYILSVTGLLNGLITSFTETEKEMVSVERAHQFESIEPENWLGIEETPSGWPQQPLIEYIDCVLQYKEDGVNALNGISLRINPGQKIGVCGRTGSGKSSMFMALFRGEELKSGTIKIDNVNIRNINLNTLRESMSIIPQDPFLFDGTLRENLDPSNLNDDNELWNALRKCRLYDKFQADPAGLDLKIDEKGKNLSSGEKQLVCLARAILTHRKILCIDEATASVDFETDKFIQKTIREEFKQFTVLTIAHRIETILDYDRICVLDKGKIIEFDTPNNLLANNNSNFYSLVNSKSM